MNTISISGKKQPVAPWIVVTGLDGSGKTSLVDALEKWLSEEHLKVKRFRSPHDTYLVHTLLNVAGSGSPDKDVYTDRTIMMLDNRILGQHVDQWRSSGKYDILLSQRGFFDAFVHGAVKNIDYETTAKFNKIWELPACQIMIHLCAENSIAYSRICDDEDADKFETPEYVRIQEYETREAFKCLENKHKELRSFHNCKNLFIDTTTISEQETAKIAIAYLKEVLHF